MLRIVTIISFAISVLYSIFGIYDQIMGSASTEKLLKKLHIPFSYTQIIIIGCVSIVIMFICIALRERLRGRM